MHITTFDIVFWLLVALIGLIAYAIEGGLAARHRRAMLMPLFAALGATVSMMFHVEDKSSFNFEKIVKKVDPNGKQRVIQKTQEGADETPAEVEIVEIKERVEVNRDSAADGLSAEGGIKDCAECPVMIAISSGFATVGSPPNEPGHGPEEAPVARVALPDFFIGKYEVTVGQYTAFSNVTGHTSASGCMINGEVVPGANWKNPGFSQFEHDPVVCISTNDMLAFVDWLSRKTGLKYRLPSESEWEYSARGGSSAAYWTGDTITKEQAHFDVPSVAAVAPVIKQVSKKAAADSPSDGPRVGTISTGSGRGNLFGIFNIHGNAWEIVADCWTDSHKTLPPGGKAIFAAQCKALVAKGGGWTSQADRLRAAARQPFDIGMAANSVGFRLARNR